jgi:hypothetical protein
MLKPRTAGWRFCATATARFIKAAKTRQWPREPKLCMPVRAFVRLRRDNRNRCFHQSMSLICRAEKASITEPASVAPARP